MDCHVETFRDARQEGRCRAAVIETATARVLYVTWPYEHEAAARARAWRWVHEELDRRAEDNPLFVR